MGKACPVAASQASVRELGMGQELLAGDLPLPVKGQETARWWLVVGMLQSAKAPETVILLAVVVEPPYAKDREMGFELLAAGPPLTAKLLGMVRKWPVA